MKKLVKLLASFAFQLPLISLLYLGVQSIGITGYWSFLIVIPAIVAYHIGEKVLND